MLILTRRTDVIHITQISPKSDDGRGKWCHGRNKYTLDPTQLTNKRRIQSILRRQPSQCGVRDRLRNHRQAQCDARNGIGNRSASIVLGDP